MDYTYSYDKSSDKLTGILVLLLFLSLLLNEITSIKIKTDINGIHDSLKFIGGHYNIFLTNCINQLITLILYIAVSASFFIGLKVFHYTLSHFITFGIAAAGLTIMVAASASLAILNITKEYLLSTGLESDIIAINGLSIAELRKNAILIAFTLEGASLFLFGIYVLITKSLRKVIGYTSIIFSQLLIILTWTKFESPVFIFIRISIIANYLLMALLFIQKGFQKVE